MSVVLRDAPLLARPRGVDDARMVATADEARCSLIGRRQEERQQKKTGRQRRPDGFGGFVEPL